MAGDSESVLTVLGDSESVLTVYRILAQKRTRLQTL